MSGLGGRMAVLTLVVALATVAVAWWIVPLVGFVFGMVAARRRRAGAVIIPAVAGFLGWGLLVGWAVVQGGAGRVASVLGGVLGAPAWAVYLLPPLYAGLLGLAAALLGSSLSRNRPVPEP